MKHEGGPLQQSEIWYMNHSPEQAPIPVVDGQHKIDVNIFVFVLFLKERP